jgi:hypothetical protein
MSFAGPQGEGSLRVTLRLETLTRYQLEAVDPVGRVVWTLGVDGERALVIDRRNRVVCAPGGQVEVPGLPLGAFSLGTLPLLLLNRLPALPPVVSRGAASESTFDVEDSLHRRWTGAQTGDRLNSWTLWNGTQPGAWWRLQGDGNAMLSVPGAAKDQTRGVQLRWREVLAEPLRAPVTLPKPPADFRPLSSCEPLTPPA